MQGLSLPAVTTGEVYEAGLYAGFACTAGLIGILILSWVRGMAPPASVHLLSRVAVLGPEDERLLELVAPGVHVHGRAVSRLVARVCVGRE